VFAVLEAVRERNETRNGDDHGMFSLFRTTRGHEAQQ
jgi:hypothetical protein